MTIDEKKKEEMQRLNTKKPSRGKSKSERSRLGNNYLSEVHSMVKHLAKDKKDSYSTHEHPIKEESTSSKVQSNTSMGSYNSNYDKIIREAQ